MVLSQRPQDIEDFHRKLGTFTLEDVLQEKRNFIPEEHVPLSRPEGGHFFFEIGEGPAKNFRPWGGGAVGEFDRSGDFGFAAGRSCRCFDL